ncbi:PAS domain-containing protein [Lacimonas salitolerans]|uniref:PAS domain-containing protein n=1 Tax=Lacimonas salitolerans TaxID=1323750 RepID=A0ABW4EBZ7_9RHOB
MSMILGDSEVLIGFSRLSIAMLITNPAMDDNPIIYVNDAFERTTGYNRSSVIGRNCRFLQGERTDKRDVDRLRSAMENARDVTVDILNYRADGTSFRNQLTITPILNDDGKPIYFLGIQKELVPGDRVADNQIEDAHLDVVRGRVEQDLSIILSSLQRLQGKDARGLAHEVEALPRRLECLQLVYEEMRLSDRRVNDGFIDLGSLLSRIANAISFHEGRVGIRFNQSVEPIEVNLESATRIGLVTCEVLSNAFRHAFDGMQQGFVELRVTKLAAGGLRIMVSDDGVGIPASANWPNQSTMGGQLITQLLNGLDATINVARGAAGTVVLIDVPVGFTDHR